MATRPHRRAGAADQLAEYRRKRDFAKTAEPSGATEPARAAHLRFVIQKHAARHLHFDLRLELDGVMKSWAVPKGPSAEPSVKRLAMQVEDHPIEYNTFEGTIPQGEYGGGTLMPWDRGTYAPDESSGDDEDTVRKGYARGDLKVRFFGERMRGSYALIRMKTSRDGQSTSKPQWLLIKHRDEFASSVDLVAENDTSVVSGRTMDEIAAGKSNVWHSNRRTSSAQSRSRAKHPSAETESEATRRRATQHPTSALELEPMYASIGTEVPAEGWTFEPKYDGVRVLAFMTPSDVSLMTRNGKDKSTQFPEIADALKPLSKTRKRSFVLDGEIIAVIGGEPARFQELQSRMHVKETRVIERYRASSPASLVLFDILMSGDEVLLDKPWLERRAELLRQVGKHTSDRIRITESIEGDGKKMLQLARKQGWEGIIAKRVTSTYQPGERSRSWLKLKVEFRQEFVVGGFTEPRNSRQHLGALLLGYYDHDRLIYVGHTGGGFTGAGLAEMYRRLKPLERKTSPFAEVPRTNEKAHWVKPEVMVEVKFSEWTADGKLRQPIYLGTRDDKDPREVGREGQSVQNNGPARAGAPVRADTNKSRVRRRVYAERKVVSSGRGVTGQAGPAGGTVRPSAVAELVRTLQEIEDSGGNGTVETSKGHELAVTNLDKVFFPRKKLTKGDLMRYYATVTPLVLPVMKDRPLVLKRFPNGVAGQSFFQQNAGDTPAGVRVETIETQGGSTNLRIVGGDLYTLLYTIQLGSISVDPWHSRIQSLDFADYAILDLDPGPRAPFSRVVEVAHWVKETLDQFGLYGALKTSGSSGLHIYLPLPPRTPNESATLVAQIIATKVAEAYPKAATIERFVKARGATTVYVDYLQNIIGKTVAAAYSARANPEALVSTPLGWDELTDDLDPREFTIETAPARFAEVGDIWSEALKKRNSLKALS
jgi:bifunctional non-homologous end joining protein LigD